VKDVIRSIVMELGQMNSGTASVTGISATLRSRSIEATRETILEVLKELEDADKILMDGEDFYLSS
jgi:hypothetical protein